MMWIMVVLWPLGLKINLSARTLLFRVVQRKRMFWGNKRSRQQDYENFWDLHERKKVSFLNEEQREERICKSMDRVNSFLGNISKKVDQEEAKGKKLVVVDTEGDYVSPQSKRREQPHYWHKVFLRQQGVPEEEIRSRVAWRWNSHASKIRRCDKIEDCNSTARERKKDCWNWMSTQSNLLWSKTRKKSLRAQ